MSRSENPCVPDPFLVSRFVHPREDGPLADGILVSGGEEGGERGGAATEIVSLPHRTAELRLFLAGDVQHDVAPRHPGNRHGGRLCTRRRGGENHHDDAEHDRSHVRHRLHDALHFTITSTTVAFWIRTWFPEFWMTVATPFMSEKAFPSDRIGAGRKGGIIIASIELLVQKALVCPTAENAVDFLYVDARRPFARSPPPVRRSTLRCRPPAPPIRSQNGERGGNRLREGPLDHQESPEKNSSTVIRYFVMCRIVPPSCLNRNLGWRTFPRRGSLVAGTVARHHAVNMEPGYFPATLPPTTALMLIGRLVQGVHARIGVERRRPR